MSESKRVVLNSLEVPKSSNTVIKRVSKTFRISLTLPESNEDTCPEFNYKDQLALAKRRLKADRDKEEKDEKIHENGLDPFADNDDDVRRIAQEMEAKYGTGPVGGQKKRKGRKDDYADIGMGYDESDSFIDNTDGYDEIIPQNVTTLHGGFYINCGALEFKTDDEATSDISSSDGENDMGMASGARKRILETSDESDTASTSQVDKKQKLTPKNSMQLAIKKKLFSSSKIQVKKRKMMSPFKKTQKDMMREKQRTEHMKKKEDIADESHKENKKPMRISSVTAAIESVVKQGTEATEEPLDLNENQEKQNAQTNHCDLGTSKTNSLDTVPSAEGESSQEATVEVKEIVKLPENLPSDISEIVDKIRQAAIDYKGETRKHFFTTEVNSQLQSLERKCKILGKSSRLRVYEHLSGYIKCKKETIIRRAKALLLEDEEKRLVKKVNALKEIIDKTMPPLLAKYEVESQKVLLKKFSKESSENEDNKYLRLPRRRFEWTDEARKIFMDIFNTRKKCFILEGKHKDNLEQQMVDYLKTKIMPLWPDGWMSINRLKLTYNNLTGQPKVSNNASTLSTETSQHSNATDVTISPVVSKNEQIPEAITITTVNSKKPNNSSDVVTTTSGGLEIIPAKVDSKCVSNKANLTNMDKSMNDFLKSFGMEMQKQDGNSNSDRIQVDVPERPTKPLLPSLEVKVIEAPKRASFDNHSDAAKPPLGSVSGTVIVKSVQKLNEEGASASSVIPQDLHCQIVDLTEKSRRVRDGEPKPTDLSAGHQKFYSEPKAFTGNFSTPSATKPNKSEDDIQMVMENLKALRNFSCSTVKQQPETSNAASVISYNKNFSSPSAGS
ncbi:unnamed protein product [Acanthoscelides obtectus]|uniref:Ubinuclein-1 n=1 Tax=Acanthoscelides obtectus TaxID=200917 RepID=A0A9P0P2Y6_ACAOB|nr:unnamed protein product [Acanthoscelides obtectus]CAK1646671.1 Ubinuclein-2 [Acanthoscelides obtectus]